jgi:quercetin dioxygenase-like cupin family protein
MVMHGPDQEHLESDIMHAGDVIHIPCGHMHRLVGSLDSWGRVAEIWEHTDPNNLSDESDIVRVQDDYSR